MQLSVLTNFHPGCIVLYPVNAYIDLRLNGGSGWVEFKGDNVRVIVVLKKLPIDLQYPFISAEDIIQGAQPGPFFFKDRKDESLEHLALPERDCCLIKEMNRKRGTDLHIFKIRKQSTQYNVSFADLRV